jgi:hypothetical protein
MKLKLSLFCSLLIFIASFGQGDGGPVAHMTSLSDREAMLQSKYLSYMSEVAHGERARKMEKRRQDLISSLEQSIREGGRTRPYKGDLTLRTAYLDYWKILLNVFREDYHKIIDLEEVAEQSYDMMEAYLLAQEKVDEKVDEAHDKLVDSYQTFAATHKVTLKEGSMSKTDRKLLKAGKVNNYVNQLYLVYFKSGVQEMNLVKALQANDINAIEQSKSALLKYADEGLLRLDTIKTFNNDGSLINATRKALEFHKQEVEKVQPLVDFILKSDEFAKLKKSYDSKPPSQRTKSEIDAYNKSVNEINGQIDAFNKRSQAFFDTRNKTLTNYDQSKKRFMDLHMPRK